MGVILAFVVSLAWLNARRKERQAFYLSDMVKNIAASSSESATEFLREYERARNRQSREAMTVGGLIGSCAAVGLIIFLHGLVSLPVYRVGLVPLLPSLAILIYALLLAPRN
jgi:hypothetical protein